MGCRAFERQLPAVRTRRSRIQRLAARAFEGLEELDKEIRILEQRTLELSSRRSGIQKRIASYKRIISPLRRIPQEVLGEIFYHCLPTYRDPIMSSNECPLLVTRVCSPWRDAAIRTPKLWDRLYIPFTDDDSVPDQETLAELAQNGEVTPGLQTRSAQPRALKQQRTDVLRRRYDAVREWLSRSGTRGLSLSLFFIPAPWYTVPYSERPPSVTTEFLSFLASLAPRWERFEMRAPPRIYNALENLLPISEMTTLTYFRAEYLHEQQVGGQHPTKLMNAPNLRRVSMSVTDDAIWGFNDQSFLQWSKLTHITSIKPFSLAQTIFLFERTPNLVHYKGKISQFSINESDIHDGRIPLLFLQSLFIIESLPHSLQVVTNLYDCMEAPKLESVTYASHHSGDNPAPIPILPLLRRSNHLQYFCLDGNDLNLWDLRTILQAVPSITNLVIGQEESYYVPFHIPTLSLTLDDLNTRRRQVWTLDELVVRNNGDSEDNPPLLPRLTSLLLSKHTAWISDDTLFDLIRSRMTASPRNEALQRVKGIFHRESQRDLAKELAHHAELVGVEMLDLDLMYGQRHPRPVEVTSPTFGLMDFNAPSWPLEDAGEMTYRWRGSAPRLLSEFQKFF